jgi:hypothetical protein
VPELPGDGIGTSGIKKKGKETICKCVPCIGIGKMRFLQLDFLAWYNIDVLKSKTSWENENKGTQKPELLTGKSIMVSHSRWN